MNYRSATVNRAEISCVLTFALVAIAVGSVAAFVISVLPAVAGQTGRYPASGRCSPGRRPLLDLLSFLLAFVPIALLHRHFIPSIFQVTGHVWDNKCPDEHSTSVESRHCFFLIF